MELERRYPGARCRVRGDVLQWRGLIQPKELSVEYLVAVRYRAGERPAVKVANPKLQLRDGQRPPHLYPGNELCLYLPHAREWDPMMTIADTIIPWASEWLLNYEIWLGTGDWTGGGEHPQERTRPAARKRAGRVL
jgi:hypothetical protein